jgi:hypothetical protein
MLVHCGHNSKLVDESGFSEEIHHVPCLLLVIFQRLGNYVIFFPLRVEITAFPKQVPDR